MSEEEPIVLNRDGIRVQKDFKISEEYGIPIVEFTFESQKDKPLKLRILDSIPSEFSNDEVGFHEEHEGEYWDTKEGNRVVFERILKPNETVETMYGIKGPEEEDDYLFETEPTMYVNEVDDGDVVETTDIDDEMQIDNEIGADETTDTTTETTDETQNGGVPESVNVQITNIQSKMQEFEAYIDALEEFINEEGTAEQVLRDVQNDLEDVKGKVENVDSQIEEKVQENKDELERFQDDMGEYEERIEENKEEIETLSDDVESAEESARDAYNISKEVEDEVESVKEENERTQDRMDEVEDSIDQMREDVEEIKERFEVIQNAFGGGMGGGDGGED